MEDTNCKKQKEWIKDREDLNLKVVYNENGGGVRNTANAKYMSQTAAIVFFSFVIQFYFIYLFDNWQHATNYSVRFSFLNFFVFSDRGTSG
jgi:hypothetical protein